MQGRPITTSLEKMNRQFTPSLWEKVADKNWSDISQMLAILLDVIF